LETFYGIGSLSVARRGDCAGYQWTVDWNNGGNQLPLIVCFKFSQYQALFFTILILYKISDNSLTGNNINITASTNMDGGIGS
jgi:hypothetical protein